MRDQPGGDSIELVARTMAGGRHRAFVDLPGQQHEQAEREGGEDDDDLDCHPAREREMLHDRREPLGAEEAEERSVEVGAGDPEQHHGRRGDDHQQERHQGRAE